MLKFYTNFNVSYGDGQGMSGFNILMWMDNGYILEEEYFHNTKLQYLIDFINIT